MSYATQAIYFIRREEKHKSVKGRSRLQRLRREDGFTLIELLIVVAIIAILAAIAVPNFLEAQTRAKISRVKADHRTLSTGLECYYADENAYPPGREANMQTADRVVSLWRLTTPVAYISSANMIDPFVNLGSTGQHDTVNMYLYFCYSEASPWAQVVYNNSGNFKTWGYHRGWATISPGPDRTLQAAEWVPVFMSAKSTIPTALEKLYDATNGTKSAGDIARYGGDVGVASVLN